MAICCFIFSFRRFWEGSSQKALIRATFVNSKKGTLSFTHKMNILSLISTRFPSISLSPKQPHWDASRE